MMGASIYQFTHPGDQAKLQSNITKKQVATAAAGSSTSSPATPEVAVSPAGTMEERGPRQSFYIR